MFHFAWKKTTRQPETKVFFFHLLDIKIHIADNFDKDILKINGRKTVHAKGCILRKLFEEKVIESHICILQLFLIASVF